MKALVKNEYRKLWNSITVMAVIALFILTTMLILIYMNGQYRTINQNGEIVSGLQSHRALKKASESLNGTLDEKYIQDLIKDYNSSYDKKYMEEHRGYLGTAGMTKYMVPNYLINFAYYGIYMTTGNDKIGLDYKFLDSEESFYKKYKDAVKEHLLLDNEWNGLFPYSEEQISVLDKKIGSMRTPFRIEYSRGFALIKSWLRLEYSIFFVVLGFALACTYAKDSTSGVCELTLSTAYGRKENMKARWIAGNLFTVTAYLLFIGILILENGAIASLHGWNASIQTSCYICLYNINVGTGLLIILAGGLLGALVMANLVMLISMKTKNVKLTTLLSIIAVGLLVKFSATYSQIKLFNPMLFNSDSLIEEYLFIGNIALPYFLVVPVLTCIYITVLHLFMRQSYGKYCLH